MPPASRASLSPPRRAEASGQLELTLEVIGGGRSSWVTAGEVAQQVRVEWSPSGQSDAGFVALFLDGRLALWVEGYTGGAPPTGLLLLRSPAAVEP
jgi:hypothetical protein